MSPETDANDHVPLEFLLGARVKHYYPESSTAKHQRRTTNVKRIFASSIHPRKREEQARELLQRVLDQEDLHEIAGPSLSAIPRLDSDKSDILKALEEAASISLGDGENIFDSDSFHLSFEGAQHSPNRIKNLQQLRDDELRRQQQRDISFHGYEDGNRPFLDVTGAAARIPHTTTRQLRDLKLGVVKAKKKLEDKRKQELIELLHEQKAHTRAALHQHEQLSKALLQQKHPRVMSTSVLPLDTIERNGIDERKAIRPLIPIKVLDPYYDQQWMEEQEHPGRLTLATLNLGPLTLPSSPASKANSHNSFGNNEEDTLGDSVGDGDSAQIRKRLSDRQREEFASNAANGLFFGGGYIVKKTKDKYKRKSKPKSSSNNSSKRPQDTNVSELLESVLGTQSASILPLAEANPPALRRREASAGRHRPRHHPHKLLADNE
ncbi:hypothetical protein ON010_g517 [Phytophthora cinnamomi]|nr:hypothetical protein ON010_g517 [Phytophthora cinnamomi]